MIKYLKSKIKSKIHSLIEGNSKDISLALQLKALKSTAEYVANNLQKAKAFDTNLSLIQHAITLSNNDGGLVCEFGVYKGTTLNFIAKNMPGKTIHGFDSFQGLPEFWRPGFDKGVFDINQKHSSLKFEKNIQLHVGWFSETLPDFVKNNPGEISFLHVDCDLYSSTKDIFQNLGPKITPGTIIVFDEYFNYPFWWDHEYKAFQEFIQATGLKYEYLGYNQLNEQVAVKILGS
jgi:Macrocin-O-methyltransferase (TylF).